ncbi:LSU ribosomal protein L21P [Palleronia marisminoris]|uniref:Large ribosomal subunit protein bL21 n=2 Tax=Palleronia marisminoris TaxID=315423 RepID=A0A1Y5R6R4_9RHOB|nr:LSU ribosomal protein L21P [Palleronia marisminoris]SLN10181.1 50S ribosomal protein L21 [Palleronia marisminoris]
MRDKKEEPMFAVLKTGGKQYRVQSGDVLRVEKLAADAGEKIQFNDILMVGSTIGTPLVDGAGVQAEVIEQIKGEKVIHFVKRRRKHGSKRTKGHRQHLTLLRITDILESGAADSGVKEAIGAGIAGWTGVQADKGDYAKNRSGKAEMKKRVASGEAKEKVAAKTDAAEGGATSKPGNLLTEPRGGEADKLTELNGVGPAMQTKMNDAGVYHFDQIAAWNEAEIEYMADQLGAGGKLAGWVDEAKSK